MLGAGDGGERLPRWGWSVETRPLRSCLVSLGSEVLYASTATSAHGRRGQGPRPSFQAETCRQEKDVRVTTFRNYLGELESGSRPVRIPGYERWHIVTYVSKAAI